MVNNMVTYEVAGARPRETRVRAGSVEGRCCHSSRSEAVLQNNRQLQTVSGTGSEAIKHVVIFDVTTSVKTHSDPLVPKVIWTSRCNPYVSEALTLILNHESMQPNRLLP